MEDVKITIRDVQAALLARFSDKTILIGHSLESDLHALKVCCCEALCWFSIEFAWDSKVLLRLS